MIIYTQDRSFTHLSLSYDLSLKDDAGKYIHTYMIGNQRAPIKYILGPLSEICFSLVISAVVL